MYRKIYIFISDAAGGWANMNGTLLNVIDLISAIKAQKPHSQITFNFEQN